MLNDPPEGATAACVPLTSTTVTVTARGEPFCKTNTRALRPAMTVRVNDAVVAPQGDVPAEPGAVAALDATLGAHCNACSGTTSAPVVLATWMFAFAVIPGYSAPSVFFT